MKSDLNYLTERIKELENENSILRVQNIEINKAKELYLKIFEDFPALIWRARLDKLCDYFNRTWLEFTGRTMEQEFGNGWAEGVHPDDFDFCLQTYMAAFDKRESFLMEYRMKNKFGEYRWIRDFGRPFYDLDNSFLGYIGSCYDITEIKQNELIINQKNNELEKLNADKDLFMSILAHDLKGPFNSILGYLGLLNENIHLYDINDIEKQINIINNSAQSAYNLLDGILMWVNSESGKLPFEPQILNIKTICSNTLETLRSLANSKTIAIDYFGEENLTVFADPNMLKTILRNLISNAIKFTNKGGQITINAQKVELDITISVSDNGIGISPETQNNLFKISQTHTSKGTANEIGTGLGLLLCQDFVTKNGGKIWVESELGKGSTFKFTVPIHVDKASKN
ncbi:MAG: PAS domain-containing sensor histidine kinase [Bacteroidales bacterium]|nr:PAS domain-containing sensor histidine kinase [Bacteroidales bacterium]